jgi:hypothetical protein
MAQSPLNKADRPQHIDIVWKALLCDEELLECADEITLAIVALETDGEMRLG